MTKPVNPYLSGDDSTSPWNAWDDGYQAGQEESKALIGTMIDDIAESLNKQLNDIGKRPNGACSYYEAAIRDDIIAMAIVVSRHAPWYDIDNFYVKAGYEGTHPIHIHVKEQ